MKTFNLKKKAASDVAITDKTIQENREDMNLCNKAQGVVGKNINLSLPVKNKDNTVPFNTQLEAARKNETDVAITEAGMDDKITDFKAKDKKQIMDINVESQKFDDKKVEEFKKAQEDSKKDTAFWDKYVGVQLEGKMKNIDNNISDSASQLHNKPERFKGKKIDKAVMASLQDADAMLFHIYANAAKTGRDLTEDEKQQITDINAGKMRLMAQAPFPGTATTVTIKEELGGAGVYEAGEKIDQFKNCYEAKASYPEGEIIMASKGELPNE